MKKMKGSLKMLPNTISLALFPKLLLNRLKKMLTMHLSTNYSTHTFH
jgi:hypothetical protein